MFLSSKSNFWGTSALCGLGALVAGLVQACAAGSPYPKSSEASAAGWMDRNRSSDQRAELLLRSLTQQEKLTLVTGYFGVQTEWNQYRFPEARLQSAGLVRGVERVGFPPQWQTDAGTGVATQGEAPRELERTLLPSGISLASSWDPELARRAGAMIGDEARRSGFNVMLAGGVNLLRDPANGRNFEYAGEDPLLAGTMVGAMVRGIQSNRIVCTVKHFALNAQETDRKQVNAKIDEAAARASDLLAFQLAIEHGDPGSVMCSYNLLNGVYACQNPWLLNTVLKRDWGFRGYVMTDWGAQHDTVQDANAGLDQETGVREIGAYQWLDKLDGAIQRGQVPQARLDDMVRRIARTLIDKGAIDDPVQQAPIDFAAHAKVSQAAAEESIVLLKNAKVLPLTPALKRVAVIGGHADVGVLTGGGSAQVYSPGGNVVPGLGPDKWPGPQVYAPSSPLKSLRAELPRANISWSDGNDLSSAAKAAADAEVAIVFVTQWTAESLDFSVTLPDNQDQLIDAVARANRNTVVVLETGGPVLMPWLDRVAGVIQAWYPGSNGGLAIARILSGAVNPSGALPVSIPRRVDDLPRPKLVGSTNGQAFDVNYTEGAAVGYRWYDQQKRDVLLPFGFGLSYTSFTQDKLTARLVDGELSLSFTVKNVGTRTGKHIAQLYVSPSAGHWEAPARLGAFDKIALQPGASAERTVRVDPRLLAVYDTQRGAWHIAAGEYAVRLGASARSTSAYTKIYLPERWLPAGAGAPPPTPSTAPSSKAAPPAQKPLPRDVYGNVGQRAFAGSLIVQGDRWEGTLHYLDTNEEFAIQASAAPEVADPDAPPPEDPTLGRRVRDYLVCEFQVSLQGTTLTTSCGNEDGTLEVDGEWTTASGQALPFYLKTEAEGTSAPEEHYRALVGTKISTRRECAPFAELFRRWPQPDGSEFVLYSLRWPCEKAVDTTGRLEVSGLAYLGQVSAQHQLLWFDQFTSLRDPDELNVVSLQLYEQSLSPTHKLHAVQVEDSFQSPINGSSNVTKQTFVWVHAPGRHSPHFELPATEGGRAGWCHYSALEQEFYLWNLDRTPPLDLLVRTRRTGQHDEPGPGGDVVCADDPERVTHSAFRFNSTTMKWSKAPAPRYVTDEQLERAHGLFQP